MQRTVALLLLIDKPFQEILELLSVTQSAAEAVCTILRVSGNHTHHSLINEQEAVLYN